MWQKSIRASTRAASVNTASQLINYLVEEFNAQELSVAGAHCYFELISDVIGLNDTDVHV